MRVDLIYLVYLMSRVLVVCGDHSHGKISAVTSVVSRHFLVCLERVLNLNITDISELQNEKLRELHRCFSRTEGPCDSTPSPVPQPTVTTGTPGVSQQRSVPLGMIMIGMAAVIAMMIGILSTVCFFTCCKKKSRHVQVEEHCQL